MKKEAILQHPNQTQHEIQIEQEEIQRQIYKMNISDSTKCFHSQSIAKQTLK